MNKNEIYFSVDIETDGPVPGVNSMLSVGCAAFIYLRDEPLATFSKNLETLEGAQGNSLTMAWWSTQPEAWNNCRKDLVTPEAALTAFVGWVDEVCGALGGTPVFVAYPTGFDFLFMHWYMMKFVGRSPFGFAALDIKSFAMAVMKNDFVDAVRKNMPKHWFGPQAHTHVALDDAIEQGQLFMNILKASRG